MKVKVLASGLNGLLWSYVFGPVWGLFVFIVMLVLLILLSLDKTGGDHGA